MILRILFISFLAKVLKSLLADTKLNTSCRVTCIQHYIGSSNVQGSQIFTIMSLERMNLSGRLSLLRQESCNSCITLMARSQHWLLRAMLIGESYCFPVGFQAIESFWVVIQSFREFFKIFNAEQLTAEPMVSP